MLSSRATWHADATGGASLCAKIVPPSSGARSSDSGAALEGRIALVRDKETDDDASPHSEDTLVDFQQ